MKKPIFFKKALLLVTFATAVLLIASCSDNQKPDDTKDIARERNEASFDNKQQKKDAQFLVDAAEFNLEKIHLGQLAQQKGSAQHIKALGKMMVDAHTRSLNELKALSRSKRMAIPTAPTDNARDAHQKLNEKTGNDFDKAYANLMVSKHQDAISTFEKASKDGNDSEIKNWASTSLPGLHSHLDRSIESQKKFDDQMVLEKNN